MEKDFVQKLSISLREAKEAGYWLQIVKMSGLSSEVSPSKNIKEGNEILLCLLQVLNHQS